MLLVDQPVAGMTAATSSWPAGGRSLTSRMCDDACLSDPTSLQRAVGQLRVSFKQRDGLTVLDGLRQAGCLKARFPRAEVPGWAGVVALNSSGGIAGGDRLDASFLVRDGARATIAAQAAERFYGVMPGSVPAQVRTRMTVAPGAAAEWLPQETILFDRCAVNRVLDVGLADDSWFLGVEMLVFGRAAMGEQVEHAHLHDTIRVRRGGRLVLHDAIRLSGDVAAMLRRPAIGGGARAVATLVHAAPQAASMLDAVRDALAEAPGECAASAWNGLLVARFLASDGASLRAAVLAALHALRDGRPLPRVWCC